MAVQGGTAREAMHEAALAWGAVAADPGRVLRHGGAPMLAALGLQLWIGMNDPLPPEALQPGGEMVMQAWVANNVWFLFAWLVFTTWATVRLTVQSVRWAMTGEPGAGFLDPGFGLRELRYLGWSLVVGLATIPALLLVQVIAGVLAAMGAMSFGVGSGGDMDVGMTGATLMGAIGTIIGYAAVAFVWARLLPGLVPVAFDRPAALGDSWKKTGPVGGFGTTLVYAVTVPVMILSTLMSLLIGAGMFSLVQVVVTLLNFATYSALAVAIVRFWYRAGEPGR